MAPHFNQESTPITVRLSSSTGLPQLPDTDPNGQPRGIAIRFVLGEHKHTDVIAHSTPHFPTRTAEEFLELLRAIGASPPGTPSPSPVESFLGSHPAALAFVQAPKPLRPSFADETFYGLNAHFLINSKGERTPIRYRVLPLEEPKQLSEDEIKGKNANYLLDEIKSRVTRDGVYFKLVVQVGEDSDATDDVTDHWPESRNIVELGILKLTDLEPADAELQKKIIFDPIARVDGIEASNDPLLDIRAAVYLISGRERRAD